MGCSNKKPPKQACKECPYKRTSLPGWLGTASFEADPGSAFLDPHWNGEIPHPCHLTVNWTSDNAQEQAQDQPLCFGFLTMMKNAGKLPRDPEFAKHVIAMERDTENFFSFPHEFKAYHNQGYKKD